MKRWVTRSQWLALIVLISASGHADGAPYRILGDQSVFAVVTHKAGLVSAFAHNHLVTASNYDARIDFDRSAPLATSFDIQFAVDDLVIDGDDMRQRWYPRLEALGVLDDPFHDVSDDDRESIRQSALDQKQLDARRFPMISARITSITIDPANVEERELPYEVNVALEAHGRTVEKPLWARFELTAELLRIEAVGTFRFTDFGIKPYSALLGTVKNKDEFHVYVAILAVPAIE